jgi:hypothetical protein
VQVVLPPHLALSSRDFLFVVLNLAAMEERKKVQETGSNDQIGGGVILCCDQIGGGGMTLC